MAQAAAQVLAAGVLAAARLLDQQQREFTISVKLLEKEELQVDGKNWQEYKRVFNRLRFSYGWAAGLLDLDVVNHPWVVGNQTPEEAQDRTNIYMLLAATAGPYKHLFHAVPVGDAQGAWKALNEEFEANTPAEYNASEERFVSANQVAMGLAVGEFITAIIDLGDQLIAKGGQADDRRRQSVLMKGLHRDFEPVTTQIQMGPVITFAASCTMVKSFATFKGLLHTCAGGAKGAKAAQTFFTDSNMQCKAWAATGKCSWAAEHEGQPCRFDHGDTPGVGRSLIHI